MENEKLKSENSAKKENKIDSFIYSLLSESWFNEFLLKKKHEKNSELVIALLITIMIFTEKLDQEVIFNTQVSVFRTIFTRLNIEAIDFSTKLFSYDSEYQENFITEIELCKYKTFSYFLKHALNNLPENNFNDLYKSISGSLNDRQVPLIKKMHIIKVITTNNFFLKNLSQINISLLLEETNKSLYNNLFFKVSSVTKDKPLPHIQYLFSELDKIIMILNVSTELAFAPEIMLEKDEYNDEVKHHMKTYKCGYQAVLGDFLQEIKNHKQENTWMQEFFGILENYLEELRNALQNGVLAIKSYDHLLYSSLTQILSETYND